LAKRQNQTLWTLQCWELGAFADSAEWLATRAQDTVVAQLADRGGGANSSQGWKESDCNPVSFSDLGTRLDQFALSGRMPCDAGEWSWPQISWEVSSCTWEYLGCKVCLYSLHMSPPSLSSSIHSVGLNAWLGCEALSLHGGKAQQEQGCWGGALLSGHMQVGSGFC
jgi:hypothetical protein